jgi:hypothetical protein
MQKFGHGSAISFDARLCNLRMLLSFVTIDKILLEVLAKCHRFLHGTFKRKLWILFVVVVSVYVLN